MKVSYSWLQDYIDAPLPPIEDVVSALTMHSFEIEGVEEAQGEKIMDVKVLPNRSHDCLSHYGIASEIAAVLDVPRKPLLDSVTLASTDRVKVKIDTNLCNRAVAVYIRGVKSGESPEWLKQRLASLGQRSINSVVDITNYLMYAFGQPTHAFDAAKLSADKKGNYEITVRAAKKGEKITLLNGKEYELDPSVVVISDNNKALDVAGVMGGKDTGVTSETTDIILTLCNFNAVSVRKTSKKLGVRTDASQRFENEVAPYLIDRVLPYALKYLAEISGGEIVGGVDNYPKPQAHAAILTSARKICQTLGKDLDFHTVTSLLARQNILAEGNEDKMIVTVPLERLDLTLPEDVAEEVGRLFGYDNITPATLPEFGTLEINNVSYASALIRNTLVAEGFSEIYTYAFVDNGEVEIENPIASDKAFLRKELVSAMSASLEHNFKYLDLLGISYVKLFEIGKVFKKGAESLHLSLGVRYQKKKGNADEEIARAITVIEKTLGVSIGDVSIVGGHAEIDLEPILKQVIVPAEYPSDLWRVGGNNIAYKPISPYPFAVRDVAVFVPSSVSGEEVKKLIEQHMSLIVVRFSLFDTFVKGDKTSYAFRLVFQSSEKTLTDEEINAVMDPIYETLKRQEGFEVR